MEKLKLEKINVYAITDIKQLCDKKKNKYKKKIISENIKKKILLKCNI